MTLLTIVFALLLDRFVHSLDKYRSFDWFDRWCSILEKRLPAGGGFSDLMRLILGIVLPTAIVAAVFYLLVELTFSLIAVPAGSIILWFCLGPRNFGSAYRERLKNKERKNDAVINQILVSAASKLFMPLFWCVLLGPVASFASRLVQRQLRRDDQELEHKDNFEPLLVVLLWPAAQLLSLTYVLVGHFSPAMATWKGYWQAGGLISYQLVEKQLRDTGRAAVCIGDTCERESSHQVADESVGLVIRSLLAWVLLVALITLGGLVA
jgi:AmpE protein